MAGLGAKLFSSNTVLTAAEVNGYLMDQAIMRFASTAARDAAFGGAGEPTLAEGMTCYLDDTNVLQSYTGSAWVSVADSTSPRILQLLTATTNTQATFTSNTPATTGLTATITPKSTSSKIVVTCSIGGVNKQSNDTGVDLYIYRNGSQLLKVGASICRNSSGNEQNGHASVLYYDNPATTSATTYAIFGSSSANNIYAITQHQSAYSVMTLTEMSS